MAGQVPQVKTEAPNQESFLITAGPFAATQADIAIPWIADNYYVVDQIVLIASTKPSVASNFNVLRRINAITAALGANTGAQSLRGTTTPTATADGALSATVTADRKIASQVDLNAVLTDNTPYVMNIITGTSAQNLIEPGNQVVLDFATTTSMAGFFVQLRVRERLA